MDLASQPDVRRRVRPLHAFLGKKRGNGDAHEVDRFKTHRTIPILDGAAKKEAETDAWERGFLAKLVALATCPDQFRPSFEALRRVQGNKVSSSAPQRRLQDVKSWFWTVQNHDKRLVGGSGVQSTNEGRTNVARAPRKTPRDHVSDRPRAFIWEGDAFNASACCFPCSIHGERILVRSFEVHAGLGRNAAGSCIQLGIYRRKRLFAANEDGSKDGRIGRIRKRTSGPGHGQSTPPTGGDPGRIVRAREGTPARARTTSKDTPRAKPWMFAERG